MSPFAHHWLLDPNVVFLNHGSFGACPRTVLEACEAWRIRFEREPVHFVLNELEPALDTARNRVSAFVGSEAQDLVFVASATAGVNTVLASFDFRPGDEILIANQTYPACRNAAVSWAARARASVVTVDLPFPLQSASEIVEAVTRGIGPRTRLALLDHVTSPTGLVLPVAELISEFRGRGIATLIDGAHAPGMLPLDLRSLGADYYVGNLHKWCCGPKGTAFLWAERERQSALRPLVVSHGMTADRPERSRFLLEFDWVGTQDPSGVLALPSALDFLDGLLPGGIPEVMARNHELALAGQRELLAVLGGEPPTPDAMVGSMATVLLPDARGVRPNSRSPFVEPLHSELVARGFQVPVSLFPAPPKQQVRVSAQLYNDLDQYRALAEALKQLLV
jgi:isopenicillin-N epimerase